MPRKVEKARATLVSSGSVCTMESWELIVEYLGGGLVIRS
jgi:hypothetical protein